MDKEYSNKLKISTHEKLQTFDSLRRREVKPGEFWDVVVVTAVDQSQKEAYELQINDKIQRKELPLGIDYKVVSDPPGFKIGNGGSTLYTLQLLSDTYGKALSKLRVLLIHAGGLSQRLPSASALGKIFTALPLGRPLYQMFELKLAMYVDFPSHMKPGVLVTCADDIELYSIADDQCITFDKPGFTALAHPSPLSIGTTHGVFVLESEEASSHSEMQTASCRRFLHKPSVAKMRDAGAVCKSDPESGEFVYTDSTYYVDFETAQTLLNLLKEVGPLDCEIDAYGDFLQALGPEASEDYTSNTSNVTKEEGNLVSIRKKIFHLLRGIPLNVILLNISKFYHIGTTSEFLFHLTKDTALRNELGLQSSAFSLHDSEDYKDDVCCVMYSIVEPTCCLGEGSVVEYSRLGKGVSVGKGSIVSSCWVDAGLSVPESIFMHSLCISQEDSRGYVTVAFGIEDDLKRSVDNPQTLQTLQLFGHSLPECLSHWGMDIEGLQFSGDVSHCSLWNACLFPICRDLKKSFSTSLEMVQAVLKNVTMVLPKDVKLLSMQKALQDKDLKEMLKFRTGLYNEIDMSF